VVHRRHFEYCLTIAGKPWPEGAGWQQRKALLATELENLRAALEWASAMEPELALRLAVALGQFWGSGHFAEGREVLGRALQRAPEAPVELRDQALHRAAALADRQGDFRQERALLEERLRLYREWGDKQRIADTLGDLAWMDVTLGETEKARVRYEERLARGDPQSRADALNSLGMLEWLSGERERARAQFEECLAILRARGDERQIADGLLNLAIATDDHALARSLGEQSLTILRRFKEKWEVGAASGWLAIGAYQRQDYPAARTLLEENIRLFQEQWGESAPHPFVHLGYVACRQGSYEEARAHLRRSLAQSRENGDQRLIIECLEGLAEVAIAEEQPRKAARLFGAAEALRETTGFRLWPSGRAEYDRQIAALRETLGEPEFSAAWRSGLALTWQRATDEAIADLPS
jgi:tetratricopeptide (TPR) repeat protein